MSELTLAAFAAETGGHVLTAPRSARFEAFRRQFDEAALRSALEERGIRWLGRSDTAFPARLRAIHDPPAGLFLRGAAATDLLARPAVAVVGARSCSSYGAHVARTLGRELAAAGVVVVSGLARGIDGEAHRGALEAGGDTVAVLGCGVDRDYPASHRELAARIAERSLVISEYAPGVEPAPWRFPARNRIVAGLAIATVVVEAREASGALITADLALEEGREVFAVPGEITSALSAGTNALLRLGAVPLTAADDVLSTLGLERSADERAAPPAAADGPAAAILVRLRDGPTTADELARATGIGAGELAVVLSELELAGLASEADGVYRGTLAGARRSAPWSHRAYDRAPMSTPYWLDGPADPLPSPAWSGRAEVAIVGGGVTGCSCALALARAGVRVRVHEARHIAEGASGRNGGFALRGGAMPYDRAREWLGADRAQAYWRWTESALDRLVEAGGDAVRRRGSLRLAVDAEERAELRDEYDALRADGFAAEWLDGDDLDAPLRGRFAAAIFHPPDAAIHPARVVRRIAQAAAAAGADLREDSRVNSLGEADADQVVVATDGYPSGLLGDLEGLIVPTRGQMLATEPLDDRMFELPHYGRHGYDYWHQTPDGALLAGGFRDASLGDEFTDKETTTDAIQGSLERFVGDLVGRPLRVTHRWCGIFGLVPDLMPVVGRLPEHEDAWVAGGYSGHGNVLGFACGELVAGAITGQPAAMLELMRPERLLQTV